MPVYDDNVKYFSLDQAQHRGLKGLVRGLGKLRKAGFWKFIIRVYSNDLHTIKARFFNSEFSVESSPVTWTTPGEKSIVFENWVFGNQEDLVWIELEIVSWGASPTTIGISKSYFAPSFDGHSVLGYEGLMLWNEAFYDHGVLIDLVNDGSVQDAKYESLYKTYLDQVFPIRLNKALMSGVYPRAFVDGSRRIFNDYGDYMTIVDFSHTGNKNVESITLSYDSGSDAILCTTDAGSDSEPYAGAGYYDFTIADGADTENIKTWVDLERSKADLGTPSINDIVTIAVKKYWNGTIIDEHGFEDVNLSPSFLSYKKLQVPSLIEASLSWTWNQSQNRWEASLPYEADLSYDVPILLRNYESIPNDLWGFIDSNNIYLNNNEYDSTSEYKIKYRVLQYITYEIDLTDLLGLKEIYFIPFVDWWAGNDNDVDEFDVNEVVKFDSNGLGKLSYISNGDLGSISITRIRRTTKQILPSEAIIEVDEDIIRIDPNYWSADSFFDVSYKALVGKVFKPSSISIYYSYRKEDLSWSNWELWDGRVVLPWKYFESSVKSIDRIRIKVECNSDDGRLWIRKGGLVLLSLREGEI